VPNWADGRRRGAASGAQRFRASLRHRGDFLAAQPVASEEVAFFVEAAQGTDNDDRDNNDAAASGEEDAASAARSEKSTVAPADGHEQGSHGVAREGSDPRSPSGRPSDAPGCRAAVCVAGQWRTFATPRVRALFRENLLGGLSGRRWGAHTSSPNGTAAAGASRRQGWASGQGSPADGCALDLFFFAKTTDAVSDRNFFFARTSSLPSSEAAIRAVLAREFPATAAADARSRGGRGGGRIRVVSGDPPFPHPDIQPEAADPAAAAAAAAVAASVREGFNNNSSSSSSRSSENSGSSPSAWVRAHVGVAWPALHSAGACFRMVQRAERERAAQVQAPRTTGWRYDWVVRTRFDLAYLWPLPPLAAFARRNTAAVLVPYTSLPISDVFAVAPRRLAANYFQADEQCRNASLAPNDFQAGS
jgi:hypothetical protein